MKASCGFAQPFGYQKASQSSISGSQDKKVYIVFCETVYVVIFKRGEDDIQV